MIWVIFFVNKQNYLSLKSKKKDCRILIYLFSHKSSHSLSLKKNKHKNDFHVQSVFSQIIKFIILKKNNKNKIVLLRHYFLVNCQICYLKKNKQKKIVVFWFTCFLAHHQVHYLSKKTKQKNKVLCFLVVKCWAKKIYNNLTFLLRNIMCTCCLKTSILPPFQIKGFA